MQPERGGLCYRFDRGVVCGLDTRCNAARSHPGLTAARPAVSFPPNRSRPHPTSAFECRKETSRMSVAFVFPGQGSQAVGMGRALAQAYPAAQRVFDEVDAALGERLSTVIWEGPADELTLTENAQP